MASRALATEELRRSRTRPQLAPWAVGMAVAVPLALLYLIIAPPAADLAAATYRSDLFARAGFALRDSGWYAVHGHYLPGYSLIAPALGALLGVRVLLALSAVASAMLFGLIALRVFSLAAARVATAWFALGFCVGLLSGRVPYDLGLALGLGALLAFSAGGTVLALALAALTSAASPIAGAFLALIGLAYGLAAGRGQSTRGLALAGAALAPIAALALAFPEGGYEPFAPSAFWPALGGVLLIALLLPQGPLSERGRRVVRVGAALYALALIGSFALQTPVGGNAARLGALLAGPLLAGVGWDRHRLILCLLAPLLLYWQLETPLRDERTIAGDPSVHADYYAPLRGELRRLGGTHPPRPPRRAIVEVPLTGAHWEAAYLAGHDGIALARGWERQLDTRYAALFYGPRLNPSSYLTWLHENRVAYVALPDVRLDYAGRKEGALIAHGLPYLREVWRAQHWRLYVLDAPSR
ncbi:MAG TPA: hypothetical protein VGY76_02430 [Solirubrobacteraceae bacterium]|jgi:hypothetical protein|nr:hypothetical protein [Solirubrobacteraceae bacterium]